MNKKFENNMKIIKKLNNDNSNFIIKVFENYNEFYKKLDKKMEKSNIIIKNQKNIDTENAIDLDGISIKPYFYTNMRKKFNKIIEEVDKVDTIKLIKSPKKICKKIVFSKIEDKVNIENNKIDIVNYIKELQEKSKGKKITNVQLIASELNYENVYKEEQFNQAIEIINTSNKEEKNRKIYEMICNFLDEDFISNGYCDFKNNKCVAQRHIRFFYPIASKNGCCFTQIRTCPNLLNGQCSVNCVSCKLFSCPYLTKRGIGYYANEFVILKAFCSKEQIHNLVFDFYKDKDKILEKINKCR